jgi:ABC-type multidrug transport system ATPase subunit
MFPMTGAARELGPPSRMALDELLEDAADRLGAVVVSTHRSGLVERARRCVVLHDGRLMYDGQPGPAPFDW